MLEISVASSIEQDVPLEMNELHWKDDGPDTPSTINDSWPWEDQIPTSPIASPLTKSGKKIIAFAHEEFPLERPPINCRMLFDTVPITTTTEQVEKNEPMYNFSSRILMSLRHKSFQTEKSSVKSDGNSIDDQHEDILPSSAPPRNSLRNRLQPHAINPVTATTNPNSSSTSKSISPASKQQQDHIYRSSVSASFPVESMIQEDKVIPSNKSPHMLSSLVSWWSSSGLHRAVKIAPNSNKSSEQTDGRRAIKSEDLLLSHSPSNTIPDHVLRPTTPPTVTTTKQIIRIHDITMANTAATMHAVRTWSSPPRQHVTSTSHGRSPSPLLTVPVRVIQRLSSTNQ